MKFTAISLTVFLVFLTRGMVSNSTRKYYRIPYGMAEFGPFRTKGENLSLEMPLSKNISHMERMDFSEKCLPFRERCSMAEECCSLKCLVHIRRCNV